MMTGYTSSLAFNLPIMIVVIDVCGLNEEACREYVLKNCCPFISCNKYLVVVY